MGYIINVVGGILIACVLLTREERDMIYTRHMKDEYDERVFLKGLLDPIYNWDKNDVNVLLDSVELYQHEAEIMHWLDFPEIDYTKIPTCSKEGLDSNLYPHDDIIGVDLEGKFGIWNGSEIDYHGKQVSLSLELKNEQH